MIEKHTLAMILGFSLIGTGMWMFSDLNDPAVEIIIYILCGVLFLVLNTAIQFQNKNPYYFCFGVNVLITPYLLYRCYAHLQKGDLQWKVMLVILSVMSLILLVLLWKGRPK